jgi:YHS domain-containing protein
MKSLFLGVASFALAFAGVTFAADTVDLKDIKCLMNPKAAAKAEKSSEWKDGKVYFCCSNCLGSFEGDKKKFASKANHQLIATKQVEQGACPFSGGPAKADQKVEFKGATVTFCCGNCKGKAEKMSDDEKLEGLFGEKAYETAKFKKAEKKD